MSGLPDMQSIYIDPSYSSFYADKLFDLTDPVLNRDNQLLPMVRLREEANRRGLRLTTADRILEKETDGGATGEYFSLGLLPDVEATRTRGIDLKAYMLLEPPVVIPGLYGNLPSLSNQFERVYLHNVHGDGYSMEGVRADVLRKFYWPIPFRGVLSEYWHRENRSSTIVVINGSHRPISKKSELYSKRIEAIAALEAFGGADLYGRGWDRLLSRCSLWWPALRNRPAIMRAYRGACDSKYETLSAYSHCLCFENMSMDGYITEKIFDCFYAGTIPVYLGPADISTYVPKAAFVDCRAHGSWGEVFEFVRSMTPVQIADMREAGRAFMEGEDALPYFHSLEDIVLGERA
ncbi:MAG: hypothetical protein JWL63_496 [Rhodocyclales bacterium]|nr:hypothetical protein [Rhodocyclales bacterium]